MNYVCAGKALYLPYTWNFVIDYTYTRLPASSKE
jgi:hypothetical protein